jgi:Mce-associated membrane protein
MANDPRPPRRRVAGERSRVRRTPPAEPGGEPLAQPVDDPVARTAPARAASWQGWPSAAVAGLLVLVVVAAAATGVLAYRVHQDQAAVSARGAATAAARTEARQVLSYDYRHLDADFTRATRGLTGAFKTQYTKTTRTVVRPSAEQYKAVVKAQVVATSVVRSTPDRVVLLLFVNQTTTSTRLDGPKVDLNRVRVTMSKAGDRWLISGLDAL